MMMVYISCFAMGEINIVMMAIDSSNILRLFMFLHTCLANFTYYTWTSNRKIFSALSQNLAKMGS